MPSPSACEITDDSTDGFEDNDEAENVAIEDIAAATEGRADKPLKQCNHLKLMSLLVCCNLVSAPLSKPRQVDILTADCSNA